MNANYPTLSAIFNTSILNENSCDLSRWGYFLFIVSDFCIRLLVECAVFGGVQWLQAHPYYLHHYHRHLSVIKQYKMAAATTTKNWLIKIWNLLKNDWILAPWIKWHSQTGRQSLYSAILVVLVAVQHICICG